MEESLPSGSDFHLDGGLTGLDYNRLLLCKWWRFDSGRRARRQEDSLKWTLGLTLAGCLLNVGAFAQSPVKVTIDANSPANAISPGFIGLSFETGSLRYDHYKKGAYFFDSTNAQLLTIFHNLGIKSVRIGGNSVEGYSPSHEDIDALFRFVKAADIRVVYSLPLAHGDAKEDASAARYIWDHYRRYLICFAIGNEPNSYKGIGHGFAEGSVGNSEISSYGTYVSEWNRFASAVSAAVPQAKLGGPDTGNGATAWTAAFAQAETGNPHVAYIFWHYEPGGPSRDKSAGQMIDEMLSPNMDSRVYPSAYDAGGAIVRSLGYSYLFTETNTHVATPASRGGNHSFATALFALDYLNWWAAHHCFGAYFHTGFNGFNGGFFGDPSGRYGLYPVMYGIAAFNLGGHGNADSVSVENADGLNLTAYATTDAKNELVVTIINREHGKGARDAAVRINAIGKKDEVIYLQAPDHDVTATSGITLGGASLDGGVRWQGRWSPVISTDGTDSVVKVGASSAAIVRFTEARITAP